jgi:hypothetical protein
MKFPPDNEQALHALKCAKFPCSKDNEELPSYLKDNLVPGLYAQVERVNVDILNATINFFEPLFYNNRGLMLHRRRIDSFDKRIEAKTLVWYYSFPRHKKPQKLKRNFKLPFDKLKLTQSILEQI